MYYFKILIISLVLGLLVGCKDRQPLEHTLQTNSTLEDFNSSFEENNATIIAPLEKNETFEEGNLSDTIPIVENNTIPQTDIHDEINTTFEVNSSDETNITQQNTIDNEINTTFEVNSSDEINITHENNRTDESHIADITPFSVDSGVDKVARIGELVVLVAKVQSGESNLSYVWGEGNVTLSYEAYLSKNDWSVGEHNITLSVTQNPTHQSAWDSTLVTIEDRLLAEDKILQERGGWQSLMRTGKFVLNQKSATVEYRTFNCGGDLIYVASLDDGYWFDEEMLYGSEFCMEGCQVELSHDGSYYKKYCEGNVVAQGKLSTPLDATIYRKIPIKAPSAGMDNNTTHILYATQKGELYALEMNEYNSSLIANLTDNYLVNGLAYHDRLYYYSYTIPKVSYEMERMDLNGSIIAPLHATAFPDGLDIYEDTIYSVTHDVSGEVTLFDLNGSYLGALESGIDDIVGIAHTRYFLYILSEDGDIYQTLPHTGVSKRIFNNDNLFEKGNNNYGLEAITILNDFIYISYINDSAIYKIDLNITQYE
jgi:hypothetical protein